MTIGTDRLFGGCLSALLDDVTGHAAAELSVSYFRPCLPSDGELLLEGFVINQSRRSLHIEATVRRADGKLLAKAHAIHALAEGLPKAPGWLAAAHGPPRILAPDLSVVG